jgi:hypothetical protein
MPEELNPQTPAGGAPPQPAQISSEPSADAAASETAPTSETGEEGEQAKPDHGRNLQRRIDRITRDKYEAQARAKLLEERLREVESRGRETAEPRRAADAEPREEDFSDFQSYSRA